MRTCLALMALAVATPALAQSSAVASASTTPSTVAVEIAGKLFPPGTYRKLLGPQMTQMMAGTTDNMGTMALGPILKAAGLSETEATKFDKVTIGQIMEILDPAYKERMRGMMDGMFAAMIPLFEQLEPDLREGLAASLDHRFTAPQLQDLKLFFATPTGSTFASQQMLLFMDPAVMGKMQTAVPKIMQAMPQILNEAAKVNAGLPKAKTYKDSTPAERGRLAKLLGIDEAKLKQ